MPRKPDPTTLCQHHSKDGKRCHMPLAPDSPTLCAFHARSHAKHAALQRDDSADLSALFSQDLPKQKSAADIHTHLWNLSLALQQGRISPRRAAVLAYIHSLLLRTLPAIEKQDSSGDSGGIDMTGAPRPIRNLPPPQLARPGVYPTPDSSLLAAPKLYGFHPSAPPATSVLSAVVAAPRFRSGESSDSHPAFSASSVVVAAPFREPSPSPSLPTCERGKSSDSHLAYRYTPSGLTSPPPPPAPTAGRFNERRYTVDRNYAGPAAAVGRVNLKQAPRPELLIAHRRPP
jgi:hypothetical protein